MLSNKLMLSSFSFTCLEEDFSFSSYVETRVLLFIRVGVLFENDLIAKDRSSL